MEVFPEQDAGLAADQLKADTKPIWETLAVAERDTGHPITWYLGGSLPGITDTPLVVAVVLEENDPQLASQIGQQLLSYAQAAP